MKTIVLPNKESNVQLKIRDFRKKKYGKFWKILENSGLRNSEFINDDPPIRSESEFVGCDPDQDWDHDPVAKKNPVGFGISGSGWGFPFPTLFVNHLLKKLKRKNV